MTLRHPLGQWLASAPVLLLAGLLIAAPAPAQDAFPGATPYTLAETGQHFARLQEAINAIGTGTGTIRIAPGEWRDCGVQLAGNITYTAAVAGETVFSQSLCEDKATLVLRGKSARVQGLVFANLRMSDGNGAGIRLEKGNLAVAQSWFRDSEQGILANSDPTGTISIDQSTFTHLGRCDRDLPCAHSIYINFYAKVSVTRTRFEAGDGGHYLKVRAGNVLVLDNSFDDSAGRSTNYMIDLPAGATGRIARNWFVQGRNKENPTTLIAVAAESRKNSSNGLAIEGNTARFVAGLDGSSAFVADWSGDRIVIGENRLAPGISRFARR